jgi:hypothetical protein
MNRLLSALARLLDAIVAFERRTALRPVVVPTRK